jgi:uncharacterized spore protein YtfJ
VFIQELLEKLATDLKGFANTETIFGEPIEIQGATIIPVCKMSIGYGGGGGEGEGSDPKSGGGKGTGGGAGGGIKLDPAALIIAKEGDISVVAIEGKSSKLGALLEMIPETLEKVMKSKEENEGDNE